MDLAELRAEIDSLDAELLELFLRRMRCSGQVALYKQSRGLEVFHPRREEEILERASQAAGPEMESYARDFFTFLMELSKKHQKELMGQR